MPVSKTPVKRTLGARNRVRSGRHDKIVDGAILTPCGGGVLQVCLKMSPAKNTRCKTMSHLTADAVVSYTSRAQALVQSCREAHLPRGHTERPHPQKSYLIYIYIYIYIYIDRERERERDLITLYCCE